ncbi:ATP-dependent Clp protease proteolytic subunit [Planctomycetota bacterium]
MRTFGVLLCLTLLGTGCTINYDETVHVQGLEDVTAWEQSTAARRGTIVLGSDIDRESAVEVSRKMIVLAEDPNVTRITMIINSNGGDTSAFRTIYNAMRFSDKPVDVVNVGNCYSAACSIFAAATGNCYAYPNAHFMVHQPQATGYAVRRYQDLVEFEINYYETVLRERGLPDAWFPLTNKDRYFTTQEALDYGFVDKIIETLP